MKTVKKALFYLFFVIFSLPVFSQTSICNSVYNFLKTNKCNPKTQDIVASNINQFPYIVSTTFKANAIGEPLYFSEHKTLFLIFSQEEVLQNKEIFTEIISFIKSNSFDFDIELLFLYGENQLIEKDSDVYSLQTAIKTINTNENSTVIFVNLEKNTNSILSTSNGITAPSWLIKNEHDIFKRYNVKSGLPVYYISQLYSYHFIKNRQLNSFFELNIPGIVLNFNGSFAKESPDTISAILKDSIFSFSETSNKNWDQHFLMINIMGKYRLLSEYGIVKCITLILICFLLFISLLGFINVNLQHDAWSKIKKIWYVVPITFAITVFSFFIGKELATIFSKNFSDAGKLYFLCSLQFIFSFIFVSVYYYFQIIKNNKYEAHSVDFMIIITIFLNQFIFLFNDISLFPLFMFGCILAIIALAVKNNIAHIAIFLTAFVPFGLYAHTLIESSNITYLSNYLFSHNYTIIFISLVLYPAFLMYFRILSAFVEKNFSKKALFISIVITLATVLLVTLSVSFIRIKQINSSSNDTSKKEIHINNDLDIQISYSDKYIFSDLIRTVKVELPMQCLQCSVKVYSENGKPVLYSTDDYEISNSNTASFLIPYNPPNALFFSYGAENKASTITVSAIFPTDSNDLHKDEFSLCTKSITIKEDGK